MFQPDAFAGRNVVVTGAGRGIGLEVAKQFLDCCARVFLHGGRKPRASLPDVLVVAVEQGRATIAYADFLVNNAGTMVGRFPADALTDQQYETVVQLNRTSVVQMTRALLPLLQRGSRSAIVNTVSTIATPRPKSSKPPARPFPCKGSAPPGIVRPPISSSLRTPCPVTSPGRFSRSMAGS